VPARSDTGVGFVYGTATSNARSSELWRADEEKGVEHHRHPDHSLPSRGLAELLHYNARTVGLTGTPVGQCTLKLRSIDMSVGDQVRKVVFTSGLMSIALSLILDAHFATDTNTVQVPGPGALALLAVGGVSLIAVAVIRRRKK
jgi:hypothetical protein